MLPASTANLPAAAVEALLVMEMLHSASLLSGLCPHRPQDCHHDCYLDIVNYIDNKKCILGRRPPGGIQHSIDDAARDREASIALLIRPTCEEAVRS